MANIEEVKEGYKVWKSEKEEDNPIADLSLDAYLQEKGWNNEETWSLIAKDDELRDLRSISYKENDLKQKIIECSENVFDKCIIAGHINSHPGLIEFLQEIKDPKDASKKLFSNQDIAVALVNLNEDNISLIKTLLSDQEVIKRLSGDEGKGYGLFIEVADQASLIPSVNNDFSKNDKLEWKTLSDRVDYSQNGSSYHLYFKKDLYKKWTNKELEDFIDQLPKSGDILISANMPIIVQKQLLEKLGDRVVNANEVKYRIAKETNVQAEPKDSSLEDNSDWRVLTTNKLTGYEFKDGAYTNGERSVRFTNKGNSYRLMVDDKSGKNEANDTELKAFVDQLPLEGNIRIGASLPIDTQQRLLELLKNRVVNADEVRKRIEAKEKQNNNENELTKLEDNFYPAFKEVWPRIIEGDKSFNPRANVRLMNDANIGNALNRYMKKVQNREESEEKTKELATIEDLIKLHDEIVALKNKSKQNVTPNNIKKQSDEVSNKQKTTQSLDAIKSSLAMGEYAYRLLLLQQSDRRDDENLDTQLKLFNDELNNILFAGKGSKEELQTAFNAVIDHWTEVEDRDLRVNNTFASYSQTDQQIHDGTAVALKDSYKAWSDKNLDENSTERQDETKATGLSDVEKAFLRQWDQYKNEDLDNPDEDRLAVYKAIIDKNEGDFTSFAAQHPELSRQKPTMTIDELTDDTSKQKVYGPGHSGGLSDDDIDDYVAWMKEQKNGNDDNAKPIDINDDQRKTFREAIEDQLRRTLLATQSSQTDYEKKVELKSLYDTLTEEGKKAFGEEIGRKQLRAEAETAIKYWLTNKATDTALKDIEYQYGFSRINNGDENNSNEERKKGVLRDDNSGFSKVKDYMDHGYIMNIVDFKRLYDYDGGNGDDGRVIVPPELEDILGRIRSRNSDSNLNYLDGVKLAVLQQMGKIDQNRYNNLVNTSVNDRIVAIDEIESKIYGDEQEKYNQTLASTIAANLANAIQNPNASGSIGVIENTPPELLAEVYKTLDKKDSNFVALEKHIDNVIEQFAKGKEYYFADVTNAAQTYYGYEDLLKARMATINNIQDPNEKQKVTKNINDAKNHNKEVIETGYDRFGVHFDGYDQDFNLSNVTTSDAKALDKRYKKLSKQAELFGLGSLKSNSQAQQILNSIDFTDGNGQSLSKQDRQIVLDNLVKIARHNMVMTSLGDKNGQMPTAANFEEHLGQVLYAASVASDVRKGIVEDIQQFTDRQKFNDFVNKALAGGVKIDQQAVKDTVGNAVNQTNAYCYRLNHKLTGKRDAQATPVVMNLLDNIKDIDERSKGRLEKVKLNKSKRETQKKLLTMLGVQGGIALGVSGIMSTVTKAGANKVLGKALAGAALIAAIGLSYRQWAKNQKKQNKKANFFRAFTSRDFRFATYTTALGAGAMTAAATGNPGTAMVLGLAAMGIGSGYRSNKYYKIAREGGISKFGAILWGAASIGTTFAAGFAGRELGEAATKMKLGNETLGDALRGLDDKAHNLLHDDKIHGFFDKFTGKADSLLFGSGIGQKIANWLHIPHAGDGNSGGSGGPAVPDPVIADHDTTVDLWQKNLNGEDLGGWTLDGTNHTGGDGYHLVGQDGPYHNYSNEESGFIPNRSDGIRYSEYMDRQFVESEYQNGFPDLQHDDVLSQNAIRVLDTTAQDNTWMNTLGPDGQVHPNSDILLYKVYNMNVLTKHLEVISPDKLADINNLLGGDATHSIKSLYTHLLHGDNLDAKEINMLKNIELHTGGQKDDLVNEMGKIDVLGERANMHGKVLSYVNKVDPGFDVAHSDLYARFSRPGEPNIIPEHGVMATLGQVDKGPDYKLRTPSAMADRIDKARRELEYKSQGNTDQKPNIDKKPGMANKKPNATSQTGKADKIQLKASKIAAIKEAEEMIK